MCVGCECGDKCVLVETGYVLALSEVIKSSMRKQAVCWL